MRRSTASLVATMVVALLAGCGSSGHGASPPRVAAADPVAGKAPRPPARYAIPRRHRLVRSSRALARALANRAPEAIVLADGTYDHPRAFRDAHGDRIYARHRGKAVLTAGVVLGGGNAAAHGALVRGLTFRVSDPRKVEDGAAVLQWGPGAAGARVLDTTLDGFGRIRHGIYSRRPSGFGVRRVAVRRFTDFGVIVDNNKLRSRPAQPAKLSDVDVAHVGRPVPRSANGRSEYCIEIGNTARLVRARVRDCAWAGIETATAARNVHMAFIDIDRTDIGVYVEHFTTDSTFKRLRIGPKVRIGVNCEWDDPAWGGKAASNGNVVRDSTIETSLAGVFMDEGTTRTSVIGVRFVNQAVAAIGDYRGKGNRQHGNDFSRIGPSAVPYSLEPLP